MAFILNPAQLLRLRKAVRAYNAAVDRMVASGKYDVVPNKTNMVQEKEFISSARDLSTRVRQLRRILTTERKDAQTPVRFKGVVMPQYMKREIRNTVRDQNAERRGIRETLVPNYDELSPQRRATLLSNRDLQDLHEEDYIDPESFDELLSEKYPNIAKRTDIYIDQWLNVNGSEEVADMIREMSTCVEGFKILMQSPDIEKEIDYIYEGAAPSSSSKARRASAFKEPQTERISKADSYWRERYNDYLNHTGYFSGCKG